MTAPSVPTAVLAHLRWFEAAAHDDLEALNLCLSAGVDVNTQEPQRHESALMIAARHGQAETVSHLLTLGADPNLANIHGNTALMIAAFRNHADIVLDLLSHNANPCAQNAIGSTVLMMASTCLASTELLLKTPARLDINTKDSHGFTPILQAAYASCASNPDARLHERCAVIKLLVGQGGDIHAITTMQQSALMLAASWGAGPVVETLLELGADPLWANALNQRACDVWPEHADPHIRMLLTHQDNVCVLSKSCPPAKTLPTNRRR